MTQLAEAVATRAADAELRGVLITSAKDVFIVGADITEFGESFKLAPKDLVALNMRSNDALLAIEALEVPVVVAINGFALGGGLERSEEHTSELQSLMRISYAVFCLKKKKKHITYNHIS